jgi:hypothetical protein
MLDAGAIAAHCGVSPFQTEIDHLGETSRHAVYVEVTW